MDAHLWRPRQTDKGTDGLALFENPKQAPAQPVATSEDAAAAISPKLSEKRRDVLLHICRERPKGVTDNELIADLTAKGWNPNTPRARRVELYRGMWLDDAGERDGSTVWIPSVKAWEWFRGFDREANGYIGREEAA